MHYKKLYPLFLLLSLLFSSCASTYYSRGYKALEKQEYNTAIKELKMAIKEDKRNTKAIRDLGIALYHKNMTTPAFKLLNIAYKRDTNDPVTMFHLGALYESRGKTKESITIYQQYVDISPFNEMRSEIEDRLVVLLNRQIKAETANMLANEANLGISHIPNNSVAVTYFNNITGNKKLDPIQKGLVDMVITDLSQIKSITVIERSRMHNLMQEIGLGMTGMMDDNTVQRMGKLLGAAFVVNGTLTDLRHNDLRIDAGLSNVKHNTYSKADDVRGSLKEFYKIEKDLVFNILAELAITPTLEERKAIEEIPTKNVMAFLYYCRALDNEDRGQFSRAQQDYQKAVNLDNTFAAASKGISRAQAQSNFKAAPPKASVSALKKGGKPANKSQQRVIKTQKKNVKKTPTKPAIQNSLAINNVNSPLNRTAQNVNAGFIPSIDSRQPTSESGESVEETFNSGPDIPLQISIPIKP